MNGSTICETVQVCLTSFWNKQYIVWNITDDHGREVCGEHMEFTKECDTRNSKEKQFRSFFWRALPQCLYYGAPQTWWKTLHWIEGSGHSTSWNKGTNIHNCTVVQWFCNKFMCKLLFFFYFCRWEKMSCTLYTMDFSRPSTMLGQTIKLVWLWFETYLCTWTGYMYNKMKWTMSIIWDLLFLEIRLVNKHVILSYKWNDTQQKNI